MRLAEVERGDRLGTRALFALISGVTRQRFPDAARVAFYDRDYAGPALNEWTQYAMRGESAWSVAERELIAAVVATWNSSPFCVGAHSAVAERGMPPASVSSALDDYRTAELSPRLEAVLAFLEKMTRTPESLTSADADSVRAAGVADEALTDAVAVAAVFNIVTRYANALGFDVPTPAEFARASGMLLKRGYR